MNSERLFIGDDALHYQHVNYWWLTTSYQSITGFHQANKALTMAQRLTFNRRSTMMKDCWPRLLAANTSWSSPIKPLWYWYDGWILMIDNDDNHPSQSSSTIINRIHWDQLLLPPKRLHEPTLLTSPRLKRYCLTRWSPDWPNVHSPWSLLMVTKMIQLPWLING